MCGLLFILRLSSCQCDLNEQEGRLKDVLKARGPDAQNQLQTHHDEELSLSFYATLLWLRGKQPHIQPDQRDGNILLWNGDIFGRAELPSEVSDTDFLANELSSASKVSKDIVRETFSKLTGPHSYVFYSQRLNTLWFGRDVFGRHSLVSTFSPCHVILSSVGYFGSQMKEVPANGIYELTLNKDLELFLHPFKENLSVADFPHDELKIENRIIPTFDTTAPIAEEKVENFCNFDEYLQNDVGRCAVAGLGKVLEVAVKERLRAQPPYCKQCMLNQLCNMRKLSKEEEAPALVCCRHSKVAVLFSGGLDSVVLAFLVAQSLNTGESVDLINVAFQQLDGSYAVPDRLTALQAYEEMHPLVSSAVHLNLVLVDVTKEELKERRESRIKDLLYPLETVLDDSIGCAVWFATRANGRLYTDDSVYCSPARVVLLGMGADEQLGGYSKHKAAFMNQGRDGLLAELQRQMNAISERNLGRDNRIVSDHGIAGRYPFLDERVVDYLARLPLEAKMNLALERGVGDKLVLRALAHSMGLKKTAKEPKRAIQFGSRIAKMENRKEKASDKAVR